MKKFIVVLFSFYLFCSCIAEKIEKNGTYNYNASITTSKCKSLIEIVENAEDAFNNFFPNTKTLRQVDSVMFVTTNIADTVLIVVNYCNNAGFVILSAQNNLSDILGVFSSGNFRDCYNHNSGFRITYEEILANQIISLNAEQQRREIRNNYYIVESTITSSRSLGPFVTVEWGQSEPFNLYCPNSTSPKAGCTPIAFAQIMSYFEYPNSLTINYTDTTNQQIRLDWRELKEHSTEFCTPRCQTCLTASHFIREIGYQCNATYKPSSTSALASSNNLDKFRYQSRESYSFSLEDIKDSIEEYRLAIITGFVPSSSVGHSWVVDGVKTVNYLNKYYQENSNGTKTLVYTESCKDTYLHFNYGDYGNGNGFILCQIEVNLNGQITYPKTLFSGTFTDCRRLLTHIRPYEAREI